MIQKTIRKLFSDNMNPGRIGGIVKEGVVVSVTEYAMLGSFVMINILVNHYYGTEAVGMYALSYSIAQVGILGIGSVFSMLMRRDLSLDEYGVRPYVSKVQILRTGNLVMVLLLAAIAIFFFYAPLRANLGLVLMMVCAKGLDAMSETYYTAYQTLERLGEYSGLKLLNAAALIGVSVFVCVKRYDIEYLYLGQVGCSLLLLAINYFLWHRPRKTEGGKSANRGPSYRFLLIESFPLMINALIFQLGTRASNIIVFDRLGEKDLGTFSIVVIMIGVFAGVANTLAIVFFGRLSRSFVNDPQNFNKRLHQTIALFFALGVAFFLLFLLFIPVIERLFGLTFDTGLYRVMSAAIPFMFVVSCLGSIFTIIRKQKTGMYLSVIVMAVNLAGYYFLSQIFGLTGAAYAFLVTAVFQCVAIYLVFSLERRRI